MGFYRDLAEFAKSTTRGIVDSDEVNRQFSAERSHKDSDVANENARAAGQAAILINGGAATAILAFLAKDKLDPTVLRSAPWCLVGYAIGVLAGAFMMFCSVRSSEEYTLHWQVRALSLHAHNADAIANTAFNWQKRARRSFILALMAFFFSSCFVAYILSESKPPQYITVPSSPH